MKIQSRPLTNALTLVAIASLSVMACQSSNNGGGSASGGSQSSGGATKPAGSGGSASGGTTTGTGGATGSGGAASGGTTTAGSGGATNPSSSGGVGSGGSKSGGASGSGGAGASQGSGGSESGGTTGSGGTTSTSATGGSTSSGGKNGTGGGGGDGGRDSGAGGAGTGGTNAGGGTTGATGGSGGGTSASCPATVLKSGDTTVTLQVGGSSRQFILHVPSAYKGTSPVPFIIDFHPITGTNTAEESSSPFKAVTDPEGVITAYPQGLSGPMSYAWNVGPCCVANVDDVAFAKAIVADVEAKACIDTKRIYAVGFSMGGGMSHYIACKAADVFAAVAPAAFDLLKGAAPAGNADDCKPARPIPVVSFRGTADTTAIYAGGYSNVVSGMPITFLGAKACWEKWASINGCTDTPTYPTASGTTFNCSYYKQCQGNVQVGVCINTGGHSYGDGKLGWAFLKQFTLP